MTTAKPASNPLPICTRYGPVDLGTDTLGTDHRSDDDHRQGQHDGLVNAGHQGWHRQRELNLEQFLSGSRTECIRDLRQFT